MAKGRYPRSCNTGVYFLLGGFTSPHFFFIVFLLVFYFLWGFIMNTSSKEAYVSWDLETEVLFDEDGCECDGEQYAMIEKIWVPESDRGQGKGRKMLESAIADIKEKHGNITIKIAALPFDNGMDMADLVAFYESVGFDVEDTSGHAVIMSM